MRHKTGTLIFTLAAAIVLTAQTYIPALACGWETNDIGTYFWTDRWLNYTDISIVFTRKD